jgi:hypothetical protein
LASKIIVAVFVIAAISTRITLHKGSCLKFGPVLGQAALSEILALPSGPFLLHFYSSVDISDTVPSKAQNYFLRILDLTECDIMPLG